MKKNQHTCLNCRHKLPSEQTTHTHTPRGLRSDDMLKVTFVLKIFSFSLFSQPPFLSHSPSLGFSDLLVFVFPSSPFSPLPGKAGAFSRIRLIMGCLNHFALDSEQRPPLWKSRMTHSLLLLTLTDDSIFWSSLLLLHTISHTLPLHQFDHFGVCIMVPSFLVHLLIPFSNLRSNPSPNPPPFTSKTTTDSVFKTSEGLPQTGRF